jgi:predicted DNA-binding antitoxin AbrB/MazE fold protein
MRTIHAVYEDGVFRPTEPVSLAQGSEVDLVVHDAGSDPVAVLTARFPDSFGIMPAADADEMQRIIDEEFGQVNPDDWR